MILVDTSIWIDHLHAPQPELVRLLEASQVSCHPCVVEELVLGSLSHRPVVLGLLENLRQFPVVRHTEVMALVEARRLWGRGLSSVDVQLLGSTLIVDGSRLWTRDKRLRQVCDDVGVGYHETD